MKKRFTVVVTIAALVVALCAACLIYLCQSKDADIQAYSCCVDSAEYEYSDKSQYLEFRPVGEIKGGLVYYQGAQVDVRAFSFVASKLAKEGWYVALLNSPFNMAIFDVNGADKPIEDNKQITNWYVGGFSLGGVAASSYVVDHSVSGLILFASYPSEDISNTDIRCLSISGNLDGLSTPQEILESKRNLPKDTVYVVIEGCNHTGFALYGGDGFLQKGDNEATMSKLEQQLQIVQITLDFLYGG